MNGELIAIILFIALLSIFLIVKRKNVQFQKVLFPLFYFIMYKTSLGLPQMDKIAKKHPRTLNVFVYFSIIAGYLGMLLIAVTLVYNLYNVFFVKEAVSGVGLVLPFKVKGGFYVPFFYWITSIIIIAVIHEFSHGVVARFYNVKIKSSGFAFMAILAPIIPAAFVEPDEKQMVKKSWKEQVAVYSAGPSSNIILGIVCLLLFIFIAIPLVNGIMEVQKIKVADVTPNSPAAKANLTIDEILISIDSTLITDPANFTAIIQSKKPGDKILVKTDKKEVAIELAKHQSNASKAFMGLAITPETKVKSQVEQKYGKALPAIAIWLTGLLYWLYLLNIGIGVFNLVPLGPVDGGRIMYATLEKYLSKEKTKMIGKYVSLSFLLIILVNVFAGFIK